MRAKILFPDYLSRFKCSGSICPDTCCQKWTVFIDRFTYEKYDTIEAGELKRIINQTIVPVKSTSNDQSFAKIKLLENGFCPLLTDDKWCRVHKELGADYLSHTCREYPRVTNVVGKTIEKSLQTSCPEAAEAVLFQKEGIAYNTAEIEIDGEIIPIRRTRIIEPEKANDVDDLRKYFHVIRNHIGKIIQDQNFTIEQRLVIIGRYILDINRLKHENSCANIPDLFPVKTFDILSAEEVPEKVVGIVRDFVSSHIREGISCGTYMNAARSFLQFTENDNNSEVSGIANRYRSARESYYYPFMKTFPRLWENYFANYFLRTLFPLGGKNDILEEYFRLIIYFLTIKTLLICIGGEQKTFNKEMVRDCFYAFGREVEHNPEYQGMFLKSLKEQQLDNVNNLAGLILS